MRGTQISGVMQIGEDGTSQWFKLADGRGFVGAVNLSAIAPPKLAFATGEWERILPMDCALLAAPMADAAVKITIPAGAKLIEVGSTENDFWEYKLPKGGVGYAFKDVSQCGLSGARADAASGSSGEKTIWQAFGITPGQEPVSFDGTASDQAIAVYLSAPNMGDLAGYSTYTNNITGKSCSSNLFYDGEESSGRYAFSQAPKAGEKNCAQFPRLVMSGPKQRPKMQWYLNEKIVMTAQMEMFESVH